MISYASLNTDIQIFEEKINELIRISLQLLEVKPRNEDELVTLIEGKNQWVKETRNYLEEAFSKDGYNDLLHDFNAGHFSPFNFGVKITVPIHKKIEDIHQELRLRADYLDYNLKLLKQCDLIIAPRMDVSSRQSFKEEDKILFLLQKLYDLRDDFHYPLEMILLGNGIKISQNTTREFADILEQNGWIEIGLTGMSGAVTGRITSFGIIQVEKSSSPILEDYSSIANSQDSFNKIIEEIKYKLSQEGLNSKSLLDELNELKKLYAELTKRNLGQLLKGKLIDLKLNGEIDVDLMHRLFNELTHNKKLSF